MNVISPSTPGQQQRFKSPASAVDPTRANNAPNMANTAQSHQRGAVTQPKPAAWRQETRMPPPVYRPFPVVIAPKISGNTQQPATPKQPLYLQSHLTANHQSQTTRPQIPKYGNPASVSVKPAVPVSRVPMFSPTLASASAPKLSRVSPQPKSPNVQRSSRIVQRMILALGDEESLTPNQKLVPQILRDAEAISALVITLQQRVGGEVKRIGNLLISLQPDEKLYIAGHGEGFGPSDDSPVTRVAGYDPRQMAELLVSMGLPKNYAGQITFAGCRTSAGGQGSYIVRFQRELALLNHRVAVKGNRHDVMHDLGGHLWVQRPLNEIEKADLARLDHEREANRGNTARLTEILREMLSKYYVRGDQQRDILLPLPSPDMGGEKIDQQRLAVLDQQHTLHKQSLNFDKLVAESLPGIGYRKVKPAAPFRNSFAHLPPTIFPGFPGGADPPKYKPPEF